MNKVIWNKLEIWERKILRIVFGGRRISELVLRRTNDELMELLGEMDIRHVIKVQRLRWLGHVERGGE